jgi:hypothetical protein
LAIGMATDGKEKLHSTTESRVRAVGTISDCN